MGENVATHPEEVVWFSCKAFFVSLQKQVRSACCPWMIYGHVIWNEIHQNSKTSTVTSLTKTMKSGIAAEICVY
jgi:hypothetical protein